MKTPLLVLIAGLSSSGKSTRVREIVAAEPGSWKRLEDWAGWHEKHQRAMDLLIEGLSADKSFVVDCAGFCSEERLNAVLAELAQRLPAIAPRIEYFDNDPLRCMQLALADTRKPYGGNGALARVAQISRDCKSYRPDPSRGTVHKILGSPALVLYEPGKYAAHDEALNEIRSLKSRDERTLGQLGGADFKAMEHGEHDELKVKAAAAVAMALG